jgi:hypothetical protein
VHGMRHPAQEIAIDCRRHLQSAGLVDREGVSQLFVSIQVEVQASGTPGEPGILTPGDAVGVAEERTKQRDRYRR